MRTWDFSMRNGSDSINFSFESDNATTIQEKTNVFFTSCAVRNSDEQDFNFETLNRVRNSVREEYEEVCGTGTSPLRENRLFEVLEAIETVIEYGEQEL